MRPVRRRDAVLEQCGELVAAELTYPFGHDTAVFKVAGKMFALVSLGDTPGQATLKCDPKEATALRDAYDAITPGYHMNKRHWVTVDLGAALPADLVAELVRSSYELVVASLPAKLRPVSA